MHLHLVADMRSKDGGGRQDPGCHKTQARILQDGMEMLNNCGDFSIPIRSRLHRASAVKGSRTRIRSCEVDQADHRLIYPHP